MQFSYAQVLITAFVATALAMPVSRRIGAAAGLLDHPHRRKVQSSAVPRTGGIGILLGMGGALLLLGVGGGIGLHVGRELIAILVGAMLIHLTGVLDDLLDLPALGKLLAQTVAVGVVVSQGVVIEQVAVPGIGAWTLGVWAIPCTVFVLVGYVNAVNLVDGLDGLASGIVLIGALLLGLGGVLEGDAPTVLLSGLLAGSLLGFLPFNLSRDRKTFLGDAGSMLLGFLLPATAIAGSHHTGSSVGLLVVLGAAVMPVLDTLTTILRRARNRVGIFAADAMHVHHRLIRYGIDPKRTVLVIHGMTLCVAGGILALLVDGLELVAVASALAGGLVVFEIVAQRRRNAEDEKTSFREILFYLLGAQDGRGPRLRGELAMAEVIAELAARDAEPAEPRPRRVREPVPFPTPPLRVVPAVAPGEGTATSEGSAKIVAFRRP